MVSRTTPNLPNELLILIFEFSYRAAGELFTPHGKSLPEMRWDGSLDNPNLFPFNLASVCRLWRDILAEVPAYWTRLRFDVDNKPILPTDAVSWTQGRPFEILVQGESSIDIFPITAALLRGFHHCDAVKYDVKYSSSLPHFTQLLVLLDEGNPQLHSIKLSCKRELEDNGKRISALPRHTNPTPLINFYNLNCLVLPCRMFLDTCREHPRWYGRLLHVNISLTLYQYRFHSPEPEDYTFQELLDHLGAMSQNLFCLYLRDLSLGFQPRSVQAKNVGPLPRNLEMHNVDPALINMYFKTDSVPPMSVVFDQCSIPCFDAEACMACETLCLRNIPDRYSLFNIFDAWERTSSIAIIEACPFFDDELLRWLSKPQVPETEGEPIFHSGHLKVLIIIDCPNFTARALCEMLHTRAEGHCHSAIEELNVSGQVSTPSEGDAEWLKLNFNFNLNLLEWIVVGPDGEIKYDIKG